MDYSKFRQLVKEGEKPTVDFKIECHAFNPKVKSKVPNAELIKDICAMANNGNERSYIIVGVSDDGMMFRNVENPKLTDDNLQSLCKTAIFPPPKVKVHSKKWMKGTLADHKGKRFVIIEVSPQPSQAFRLARDFIEYKEKLCYRRNEVWIRRGSTSDLATPEEISELVKGNSLEDEKKNLISQLASPINILACDAARILRDKGWHKDLTGISLWKANLEGSELWEFNLSGTTLTYANLKDTNLNGAILDGSDLIQADFEGAHFHSTSLKGVKNITERSDTYIFKGALFQGADLSGAKFLGIFNGQMTESEHLHLQAACSLLDTIMPNGKKYNGCYSLYDDLRMAEARDIPNKPNEMADFYGVSIEEYNAGQEWYKNFDQKYNWWFA